MGSRGQSISPGLLRQHRQHRQRPCPRVDGCRRGLHLGRRLARPKIAIVGADDADGADGIFACARILMILLPSRPPRLKVRSMANTRRKVCARRRRPASARGFWGQPALSLDIPSAPRSAPARKRSAAVPVQELRSVMISRTQAATGSASIIPSIAALRFAS